MTTDPERPRLLSVAVEDYHPDDLGAAAYATVARLLDESRQRRARRLLDERSGQRQLSS